MRIILFTCLFLSSIFGNHAESNAVKSDVCEWDGEETSEESDEILQECYAYVKNSMTSGADINEIGLQLSKSKVGLRRKRNADKAPVKEEDRLFAGCILQCMIKKYDALDENGMPSRNGMIKMMTSEETDVAYKMASVSAINKCIPYALRLRKHPILKGNGEDMCSTAYYFFDCLSDELDKFCE